MNSKLYSFHIDILDLIIYVLAWASLWYIYDYMMIKYCGDDQECILRLNIYIFGVAAILILMRNIFVYEYR